MPKPLVVVIGSNGQFGSDIVKLLTSKFTVKALTHKDIDITKKSCYDGIVALEPQYVINTAAFHNLKVCEEEPEKAFLVNAWGTLNLAMACNAVGATFVHTSTDHVFGGETDKPYFEDSKPSPVSSYGRSKLLGEQLTTAYIDRYYILRVSTLYGYIPPSGKPWNFIDMVVGKAVRKERMTIVNMLYSTPTFTVNAANKLVQILEKKLPYGVYHCSDAGISTFFDLAVFVCKYLDLLDGVEILPLGTPLDSVPRPKYCIMSGAKLEELGVHSMPWEEGVMEYLDHKYPEYAPKR